MADEAGGFGRAVPLRDGTLGDGNRQQVRKNIRNRSGMVIERHQSYPDDHAAGARGYNGKEGDRT
jgi:hypothetical protein